ncbi:MAG: hypothetical protein GY860_16325 [Desulfobacteraceae bacterium]|nr:hypothetical protein [Desulfobacteraceae bacterium]
MKKLVTIYVLFAVILLGDRAMARDTIRTDRNLLFVNQTIKNLPKSEI